STKRFTFVACPYLLQTHPRQQRFVRTERSAYLSKIKIPMVNVLLRGAYHKQIQRRIQQIQRREDEPKERKEKERILWKPRNRSPPQSFRETWLVRDPLHTPN
ncbi:unnamed protein product, partial [Brassica oleracea]